MNVVFYNNLCYNILGIEARVAPESKHSEFVASFIVSDEHYGGVYGC